MYTTFKVSGKAINPYTGRSYWTAVKLQAKTETDAFHLSELLIQWAKPQPHVQPIGEDQLLLNGKQPMLPGLEAT